MTAAATLLASPGLPYYRRVGREEEVFKAAYARGLPLLLKGPTGCGKSRFVEAMAATLNRPLITVACHDETSSVDLLGRFLVKGNDTIWQDGPVTRAVRQGAILYLDEIAEAREDVVVVLHPLSDHRRELVIDRQNETLRAPSEFMLIASYNPGYQRGLKELKASTRQRFVAIAFDYPEASVESEIVATEASCEPALAARLVSFANKTRKLDALGLGSVVSTRLLVDAALLIGSGLPARLAVEVAVVQPLSDDRDTTAALIDLVALTF